MSARRVRRFTVLGAAVLLSAASPETSTAQVGPDSAWRISGGGGAAWILSGHRHMDTGQVAPSFDLAIERSVGEGYALGLAWIATWYQGDFGDERRHTLALTASARPTPGLQLAAGLGPGVASFVTVDGPPTDGVGDANIDVFEGETGLSSLARIGFRAPLSDRLAVSPTLSSVTHWLLGETMTYLTAGLRVEMTLR